MGVAQSAITPGRSPASKSDSGGPRYSRIMAVQPLPQAVFILGRDGKVHFGRAGNESETGDDETFGTSIDQYINPDQREFVRQTLAWVFERGEAFGFELHGLGPHHLDSWFQCRLVPNLKNGKAVSATLIATDVTVYKQREVELERERDDLRQQVSSLGMQVEAVAAQPQPPEPGPAGGGLLALSLNQAGEAVFLIDPDNQQVVDTTQTGCAWLKLARDQVIGRTVAELRTELPLLPPERNGDLPFTETRGRPRPVVTDGLCRRRDGSAFAVQATSTRVHVEGKEYVLTVVRDAKTIAHAVQQLSDFETRYRNLFEDASDAVVIVTRMGTIADANAAAAALFQLERDEMTGVDTRRLLVFRPGDVSRFQELVATEERAAEFVVHVRQANGLRVPARFSAVPLKAATGAIRGYQCVVRPTGGPESEAESPAAAAKALVIVDDLMLSRSVREAVSGAGLGMLTGSDAGSAIHGIAGADRVAVIVLEPPHSARGLESLSRLLRRFASVPVIVLGDETELSTALRLQLRGTAIFLTRSAGKEPIAERVRAALASAGVIG